MPKAKTAIVIPTFNGKDIIHQSIDSLLGQIELSDIIVVENGSSDGTEAFLKDKYPKVQILKLSKNRGFSGGVNVGIRAALDQGYKYIALFNNDAVAEKDWLARLEKILDSEDQAGIVTSKMLDKNGDNIDSTGDFYTTWGLPFPRGRGQKDVGQYDQAGEVFGASGGASLYRAEMLKQIGLFDEDFFAYYEDVDISFRAQLAGWKVFYEPTAVVYHSIGATSAKMRGFTTYQTLKNLPWLYIKNVPFSVQAALVSPRFCVAYFSIFFSAIAHGNAAPALKGLGVSIVFWPKKWLQRYKIQAKRKVKPAYIASILIHDLPPDAHKLRRFRHYVSLGRIK